MASLNVLCIGDIVGSPGRAVLKKQLKTLQAAHNIDFTVANLENVAGGTGITKKTYAETKAFGIQAFTSGNHVYKKQDIMADFDLLEDLTRPLNFPEGSPGQGIKIWDVQGTRIAIVNLIGRVFMGLSDCPFQRIKHELPKVQEQSDVIIVDMHAEATSEKVAMATYLDGEVALVFGTHTHIMTADDRILPKGTGYITDLGMTGSEAGILGVKKDTIIQRFFTQLPSRFETTDAFPYIINGIVATLDTEANTCTQIYRIFERYYDK